MSTPRRQADPERDKRNTLKLLAHASKKRKEAEAAERAAMKFARDTGASLREIAEQTGLGHMTVKRILERTADTDEPS